MLHRLLNDFVSDLRVSLIFFNANPIKGLTLKVRHWLL